VFAPYVSWEIFAGTFWGRQKKQVERLFFCIDIIERTQVWSCLCIWCHFHIACFCFNNKKKNWENLQDIFFLGFSDIVCVFTWYLNSVSINLLYLDIIESLWLYWPSVFSCLCKSRIAFFLMQWKSALFRAPLKVHLSFFDFLLLKILDKRRGPW